MVEHRPSAGPNGTVLSGHAHFRSALRNQTRITFERKRDTMFKETITGSLFVICVLMMSSESAEAQIYPVLKTRNIVHKLAIHRAVDGTFVSTLLLQCHLRYTVDDNKPEFDKGYLSLFLSSRSKQFGNAQNVITEFGFRKESDILKFISLLDELYATPLDGVDHLTLKLQPSRNGSVIFIGTPLTIVKSKNGYKLWSRGHHITNGIIGERGWYDLDVCALRMTLARAAKEARIVVPKPSAAMQKELDKVGKKPPKKTDKPEHQNANWSAGEGGDAPRTR